VTSSSVHRVHTFGKAPERKLSHYETPTITTVVHTKSQISGKTHVMFDDGKRQESLTQHGRQQGMQITIERTSADQIAHRMFRMTCKKMRSGPHDLNPVVLKTYMSIVEVFVDSQK
jgi:hypothetical protein